MDKQPKCKKCGRRLKSPMSIARGMGLTCAGITATSGMSVRIRRKPHSGAAYSNKAPSQVQAPLFPKMLRQRREERRRLFETRLPFQCGLVLPARKPLVYTPLEDGSWQENLSGKVISHERLQQYLMRYHLI